MLELRSVIKAVGGVFIALIFIDLISQESWLFSVDALIAWTVASFAFDYLTPNKSPFSGFDVPQEPVDFLIYSIVVVIVSAVGAWVVQLLMPTLFGGGGQLPKRIEFTLILTFSLVASCIAYLLPNFTLLLEGRES